MKKKMIGLLVSMMTVAFSLRGCKEAGKIEETNSEEMTEWLTNEQNQTLRFAELNMGPSNVKAAAGDEIAKVPAIQAILEQSQYGTLQRIGNKYWDPCTNYAHILMEGNPNHYSEQELVDELVKGITESAAH